MIECEQKFSWLKFTIAGKHLKGTGSLKNNVHENISSLFYILPFFKSRFDRITVETKGLKTACYTLQWRWNAMFISPNKRFTR